MLKRYLKKIPGGGTRILQQRRAECAGEKTRRVGSKEKWGSLK